MKYLILGSIAILTFATAAFMQSRSGSETAEYVTVSKDGDFEVRMYSDVPLVSTKMDYAGRRNGSAFSRLFGYISGRNDRNQKIPMTSPVFSEPGETTGRMSFVLPKDVATNGSPSPTRDDVSIETMPAGRFAAFRFSGWPNSRQYEQARRTLEIWVAANDLETKGGFLYAGYDPPSTPGYMRRNEVLIRLAA